jgi:probable phosphomutase (TIGR03848 family)
MATVLLVRHGRTAANAHGGLAGRSPVPLDETGRAQAVALGERLRAVPLATVVTSPLPRCRQTVALALPQVPAVVEDRLTECGYGDWQGRPLKELTKDPLWSVVQLHPSAVTFPGPDGESMAAMSARAVAAVREWDATVAAGHGPHAVWLACSHGDVIKAVVADALGLHLDQFQRIVVDPGSVTAIRYTPTRPFLLKLGDTGELRFDPPSEPAADPAGDRSGDLAGDPAADRSADPVAGSDAPVGGGAGGGSFGKVEA